MSEIRDKWFQNRVDVKLMNSKEYQSLQRLYEDYVDLPQTEQTRDKLGLIGLQIQSLRDKFARELP